MKDIDNMNNIKVEHNKTCTCDECMSKYELDKMSWWVFWEHGGYMEEPKSFDSYEKALRFAKKEKSFMSPYIVFGIVIETYGSKGEWKTRVLKGNGKQK